jgi:hypothetical protein
MADFGVLVNTNVVATMATGGNRVHFVGGSFPGGTISALNAYASDRAGTAAFNDFDFAIYAGGDATGPEGATLIWESKRYNAVAIGAVGWKSILATGDAAPSVAAAAGYVWIMLRSNDGIDLRQVDGADRGDFATFGNTKSHVITGTGDSPGEAWPTTFPADGASYSETMKVYLSYSNDTTPDGYVDFTSQTAVPLSSLRTSNSQTIAGIDAAATVTVSGGGWRKNGVDQGTSSGSVVAGDAVVAYHTSSASDATTVTTTLTIGGVARTFASTTGDATPAAFTIADRSGMSPGVVSTSDPVTPTGFDIPAPISVSGASGEYSIDGGAFTAAAGTINPGQSFRVRHTTSATALATVTSTVSIRGVTSDYSSTTGALAADSYRTASKLATTSNVKFVDLPKPTGAVNGEDIYAGVLEMTFDATNAWGTMTSPGWTQIGIVDVGAAGYTRMRVFHRRIAADSLNSSNAANEPGVYRFTTDYSGETYRLGGQIQRHAGLANSGRVVATQYNPSDSVNLGAPSVDATGAGALLVFWAGADGQDPTLGTVTFTAPTDMVEADSEITMGNNYGYVGSATTKVLGAGATGAKTATLHVARRSLAISVFVPNASAATGPTITGAGSGGQLTDGGTATITGTGFTTATGSATVKISPTNNSADSGAVTQSETARSSTSITINVSHGDALFFGQTKYLFVADSSGNFNSPGFPVQILPRSGQAYVTMTTPATTGERVTAIPDLVATDQLQFRGLGGQPLPAGFSPETNGRFFFTAGNPAQSFEVRAGDAADQTFGAWAVQTIADTVAPTATGTPGVSQLTFNSVTVNYAPAYDYVGVARYESRIVGGGVITDRGTATNWQQTGLNPGQTYSIEVRAVDAAGNAGPWTASASFTTPQQADSVPPTTGGNPTVSITGVGAAQASWPPMTDNIGILRYEWRLNGGAWTSVGLLRVAALTGLTQLTNYTFDVRGLDAALNATTISATFATPDWEAPVGPPALTITPTSGTSATVSFDAATDNVAVTGYESSLTNVAPWTDRGNNTTFTQTGLVNGQQNTIYVRAYDAAGNRGQPRSGVVTMPDTQAPAQVTGVQVSQLTANGATLSWLVPSDNVGVTGFRYRVNAGATVDTPSVTPQVVLSNLPANTAHTFEVQARDAAGNWGAFSAAASFTTLQSGGSVQTPFQTRTQSAAAVAARNGLQPTRLTFSCEPVTADYIAFSLETLSTNFKLPLLPTGGAPFVELVLIRGASRLPLCSLSEMNDRVEFIAGADLSQRFQSLAAAVATGSVTIEIGGYEALPSRSIPRAFSDGQFTLTMTVTT